MATQSTGSAEPRLIKIDIQTEETAAAFYQETVKRLKTDLQQQFTGSAEPPLDPQSLIKMEIEPEQTVAASYQETVKHLKSDLQQLLYADDEQLLYSNHEVQEDIIIGHTELLCPGPGVSQWEENDLVPLLNYKEKLERQDDHITQEDHQPQGKAKRKTKEKTTVKKTKTTIKGKTKAMETKTTVKKTKTTIKIKTKAMETKTTVNKNIKPIVQRKSIETVKKHTKSTVKKKSIATVSKFALSKNLSSHELKRETYTCETCNKTFKKKYLMTRHLVIHQDQELFCKICSRSYSTKNSYKKHLELHSSLNVACNFCGKTFTTKYYLSSHKLYYCKVKNAQITSRYKEQMDLHSDVSYNTEQSKRKKYKEFICDICNKVFKAKFALVRHLVSHGTNNFACNICNKKFRQRSNMQRHVKCHNVENFHSCNLCEKRFTTKYQLKKHTQLHALDDMAIQMLEDQNTDMDTLLKWQALENDSKRNRITRDLPEKFICDNCSLVFNTKTDLIKHMLIHAGAKTFLCNVCKKKYRTYSGFAQHLPCSLSCEICDKTFSCRRYVKDHSKLHARGFLTTNVQ